MADKLIDYAKQHMFQTVEYLKEQYSSIRTGRANAGLFEKIMIDYYGVATPLKSLATINVVDVRSLVISPFDRNAAPTIVKAIRESDLGVNPNNDGGILRVNLPDLTKERREQYVKLAKQKAEEARVSIRNIRRHVKQEAEKSDDYTQDDVKHIEKLLDEITKDFTEQIDKILGQKTNDLLEV
ncbi:MAG: ribosome recycling factor [Bifidobacteriaceae bacterium]|jgi:ribosome recycling factor|nr:ribosome recycling factor [Bifidobacteriaceae bacterium]